MASENNTERNVYVVYKGRIDRPTIYSSWAHVHPRVIGFNGADHEEFERLEQARNAMKERMIERYDEALKPKARELVGEELRGKYYAVAYGYTIGVFQDWETAQQSVKGFKNACYQRFDTEHQAKEFIEDWNDAFADIWYRAIRNGLRDGWKAKNLGFSLESILRRSNSEVVLADDMLTKLANLKVEETQY